MILGNCYKVKSLYIWYLSTFRTPWWEHSVFEREDRLTPDCENCCFRHRSQCTISSQVPVALTHFLHQLICWIRIGQGWSSWLRAYCAKHNPHRISIMSYTELKPKGKTVRLLLGFKLSAAQPNLRTRVSKCEEENSKQASVLLEP